jgi:threonine dehydratase
MPRAIPSRSGKSIVRSRLSLAGIEAALNDINPKFLRTPQFAAPDLSARLGCEIVLKDETANPIGCFKGRGSECLLARAAARGETDAIVCASAGNFGLALAYSCASYQRDLTVFVSVGASPAKVDGIVRCGARVIVEGEDFDAAKLAARAYAESRSLRFVEDGADIDISEGAGSIALELLSDMDSLDTIVVPLGNGALLAGIARWTKAHSPATEVIGICSSGAPVMFDCWRRGSIASTPCGARADTIADGIAVRVPLACAVEDLIGLVDDVLLVDDAQLLGAMRWLHEDVGVIVEPSAAAGIAAISAHASRFAQRRTATVLTGANLTREQISRWFD